MGLKGFQKGNPYGGRNKKNITWKVDENGCWICTSHYLNKGYPIHQVNGNKTYVSHTMFKLYKGDILDNMHICHTCDNPNCINPDHLFLGTNTDNYLDKINKNRHAKGEKCNNKLSEKDVSEIREKCKTISQRKVAKEYNISQQTISRLITGQTWKHLKTEGK